MIFANMVTMASRDYIDIYNKTDRNQILERIDWGFSCVFVFEAVLKIITNGFVIGKSTYLRDPWNVIDFAIVIAAIGEFVQGAIVSDGNSMSGLKALRVLRVLRPLKAIKSSPSIRLQVAALLMSIK